MRNFYQFKHLHRADSENLGEERDDDCHSMFMENSFEDPFAMQERRNQQYDSESPEKGDYLG